ncbi:2-hydroxychromene-2-carboxylate isomerase [Hydrogenophaga sp. PBL-H3]|uniref:2-hydroxychromene-2-carboxylate isomerase n=1 Tax=Hydrogenophaga sp. PBL-H3 TaxID=434010 RepID=UPI00131FB3A3|nr:2-hydroxychromene-2-carboxylate isomerase [Hydrogenophaga sp. PBL-H3]QHE78110.1 2-hydroxychromene-2-carboxylate isomerase [Hydrogenophaga sp. PBL-H3]QHE82535.1 2-hydroxychromene-2-carboxylate isomerase [Hydrogenophaga sp. PBL-H3]
MRHTVDYFLAPQSPWTYLGHERFAALVRETGSAVRVRPMDLGKIFPLSGGLPLPKRAPQRQAYRLLELRRFSEALGVPLHPQPRFFPVAGDPAARLITAVALHDGADAAMKLTGAVTTAVWAQERDIADPGTLAALLAECALDETRLGQSEQPDVQALYDENTQAAIDASVFGAPSYVIDGELFWGQDRLDFVARKLRT